jgi:lysophospholipase L1-like esterase
LGDSYTIGEGVSASARWPVQLATTLKDFGLPIQDPQIIARTGWTTSELMTGIQQANPAGPFDLVSLQIGVNNQYRGGDLETYRLEFRALLGQAVDLAGGEASRVMVLSIPDWGVTPFAAGRAREQIAAEIDQFNAAKRAECERLGAHYIDITPISRRAGQDTSLLAADGLHPSEKMYAAWVEQALPVALSILGGTEP